MTVAVLLVATGDGRDSALVASIAESLPKPTDGIPAVAGGPELLCDRAAMVMCSPRQPVWTLPRGPALPSWVEDYLRERTFERNVDLDDKVLLRRLAENDAQQTVIGAFGKVIRGLAIEQREATIEERALRVSDTPPFPWSRETVEAERTVFDLTPVDNRFEPLR